MVEKEEGVILKVNKQEASSKGAPLLLSQQRGELGLR